MPSVHTAQPVLTQTLHVLMLCWCRAAHAALFCSTQLICLMADHWYLASMTLPVLFCSLLIQYLVHLNASQLRHPDEFLHLLQTPMLLMLILWIAAWYSSGSSSSFRQSFSCRNLMASCWSWFSFSPLANLLFAIFRCFCMASNACKAWAISWFAWCKNAMPWCKALPPSSSCPCPSHPSAGAWIADLSLPWSI